jgi:hypothetical protein
MRTWGTAIARWAGARALVVLCIAPAVLLATVAPAACAATLPPELLTLEHKLAQLKVSSLRFSLEVVIAEAGSAKPAKPLVFLAADGEAGGSPLQAQVDATSVGRHQSIRTIGDVRYEYRPHLARRDGGRPWVYSKLSPSARAEDSVQRTFSALVKVPISAALNQQASLAGVLAQAQSVEEIGPTTLDGQQVTQFNATLDSEIKRSSSSSSGLTELLTHSSSQEGSAQSAPARTVTLELFIAPSGLPVRTRVTVTSGGSSLVADADIPAIDIPVHVAAPPTRATISRSRLRRIEQQRTRRTLVRARRNCRRLRGPQAVLCRRRAAQ